MKKGLVDLVREERLLEEDALQATLQKAARRGVPLALALVEDAGVTEARLLEVLERRLRLQRVDVETAFVDLDAVRELQYELAATHLALPLSIERRGGKPVLRVALADPLDSAALDEIATSSGCRVEPVLAAPTALAAAITRAYRGMVTQMIPRRRGGAPEAPMEAGTTQPQVRIEDAAPVEVRLRALLGLLVEKGVLAEEEYVEAVRRQLRGVDEE